MDDLILILDEDDLILETESDETEFVDDRPSAHQYDDYTGSYEVTPSLEDDIELPTSGKLMTQDLTVLKIPLDPAEAEITGTNELTPILSVTGNNVTLGSSNTGISVTAVGGGTASTSVSATVTGTGYATEGTVLDTATFSTASTSTTTTLYIQSMVVPAGKQIAISTQGSSSMSITNSGFLGVNDSGWITVGNHSIVEGSSWVETTVSSSGTYYGKVVVDSGNLLQEVYPVGSLYATETSTDNPATILGFGTWTKYAPKDLIWNDTEIDWSQTVGVTDDVYVWKRTA